MIKNVLVILGLCFFGLIVYSFLPRPWTNKIESQLYWNAFLKNQQAISAFKGQDLSMATNLWAEGLSTSPDLMELHYNLGLGWQQMNRSEDAVKAYNLPLKNLNTSSQTQFASLFNLGVLYQTSKDVDKALSNYQAALDIIPDSRETKINIELMIQQQQGGGGKGQDQNDQSKKDDKKDQNEGQGEGDQDKPQDQDEKKEYAKNPPPQKKQFESQQLSQSDVNKILGEIKQQEQKIRAEYNKKESKEQPRDKDW